MRLGVRGALDGQCEVDELDSRDEAIEHVRDVGDYDVAVIDYRQRGGNGDASGTDTIREMRKAEPGMAIVAHGDRPERHLASEAFSAGACAYITR